MGRDMPPRDQVDPQFDGHLDRPWREQTPDEKLDWIWEMMELRRLARRVDRPQERQRKPRNTRPPPRLEGR